MDEKRRGILIVFEGIDGAGKTLQCDQLEAWLVENRHEVVRLFEPTRGPWGSKIRELARTGRTSAEEEMNLFLKDRTENVERNIRPALERGAVVLLDRYYYSSMAYQGARGIDPERIRRENEAFAPRPDLLLYLAIPVETALERIDRRRSAGRDLFEKEESLRRVRAIFEDLQDDYLVRIDATQPPEKVQDEIREAAVKALKRFKEASKNDFSS